MSPLSTYHHTVAVEMTVKRYIVVYYTDQGRPVSIFFYQLYLIYFLCHIATNLLVG